MSSLDDLFKASFRNEIYKSAKLAPNGHAKFNGKQPAVSEPEDEDMEAGPTAPPDDDEDYGPDIPDDEEGRFFGGGVTQEENEILDYMEGQESADIAPEKIDTAWLRKLALNFEKKITKNAELRAKFEDDPTKFMGSEADLDTDVKALSILAEHPELYGEFAKLGCVGSLVGLLAHENTDIAIDAIEIVAELTDEDVEAEEVQWRGIVDAMVEADLLDLLVSNFRRFEEGNESDRSGVYHALSVLENLASQVSLSEKIGQDTEVLKWLLQRIQKKESPVTQNKQYSAEVLAILLQSSPLNRRKLCELDGVDILLQLLAAYRKRDPVKGTEEEEFVENVFDSLTCVVDESEGKQKFVEAEGVELCLIMIREGKMSKPRALRLMDHALAGQAGAEVAEKLVDAAGLKVVFSMFMKKQDGATTEHLLGIFSSLLRALPAGEAGRIRTLAKFVEKDYEKIEKLVKLRRDYAKKVAAVDDEIRSEQTKLDAEEKEEMADEWLSRRLDAGLFCLQTVDVILAWLVAEDAGAEKRIRTLFADRDETLAVVKATIQEQLDTIVGDTEEETMTKEMLTTLVQFLT
ncbi:beta-catenin-like protein-like protein 1 [Mollisia scopiformis]|uniref:Beta-catenin-like protein-like protein 1 n=1 Tax=Mollisia scopiformis TaxID=149040 RepID=A0A194XD44_MOLSC|nr:beta-catenin-like protein-like protein 1 [Mollisia scopiformis]KUJ18071.1 beta-catenin-like protein-like protein 1 [Mollisia scopiformis]